MCFPLPLFNDIRYQLDLAGGALMDVGCYTIHQLRTLAGAEPEVVSAEAKCADAAGRPLGEGRDALRRRPDRQHRVLDVVAARVLTLWAQVTGELGELKVLNMTGAAVLPPRHGEDRRERDDAREGQGRGDLLVPAPRVRRGGARGRPVLTPPADSIANMRVIDAVYRAAGPRAPQPTPVDS